MATGLRALQVFPIEEKHGGIVHDLPLLGRQHSWQLKSGSLSACLVFPKAKILEEHRALLGTTVPRYLQIQDQPTKAKTLEIGYKPSNKRFVIAVRTI